MTTYEAKVARTPASIITIDISSSLPGSHSNGTWMVSNSFMLNQGPCGCNKYKFGWLLRSNGYGQNEAYLKREDNDAVSKNYRHHVVCDILNHPDIGSITGHYATGDTDTITLTPFFTATNLSKVKQNGPVYVRIYILTYSLKVTNADHDLPRCNPDYFDQLENMLKHELHTDVTIKVKGQTFKAHKAMLATRCDYFAKMFDVDMVEKRTSEIAITDDYSPEAIKGLLSYIYVNEVPNLSNVAHELFTIAHAYGLDDLHMKCEKYIGNEIDMSNIINTLKLAQVYNSMALQTASNNFVQKHETLLVKWPEYINYLIESMSVSNVSSLLILSQKYKIESLELNALNYITENLKDVMNEPTYRNLYKTDSKLILMVDDYIVDSLDNKSMIEEKETKIEQKIDNWKDECNE